MPTLNHILQHVTDLGNAVSTHRVMHAVKLTDSPEQHISRVIDGDGPDESYRRACELAQMVGIELKDG